MPTAAPQPITASCSRRYRAAHSSGRRDLADVRLIVLHDTEGATAAGAARWFTDPRSSGSAHLVVDGLECYRTLDNADVPLGAPGANRQGFHIEQAGYARWSLVLWRAHWRTLERAAFKTALHCRTFGIPAVFLTAPALRAGRAGVTTHRECSRAFGGDHSDPGPFWPRRRFMRAVRRHLAELDV